MPVQAMLLDTVKAALKKVLLSPPLGRPSMLSSWQRVTERAGSADVHKGRSNVMLPSSTLKRAGINPPKAVLSKNTASSFPCELEDTHCGKESSTPRHISSVVESTWPTLTAVHTCVVRPSLSPWGERTKTVSRGHWSAKVSVPGAGGSVKVKPPMKDGPAGVIKRKARGHFSKRPSVVPTSKLRRVLRARYRSGCVVYRQPILESGLDQTAAPESRGKATKKSLPPIVGGSK